MKSGSLPKLSLKKTGWAPASTCSTSLALKPSSNSSPPGTSSSRHSLSAAANNTIATAASRSLELLDKLNIIGVINLNHVKCCMIHLMAKVRDVAEPNLLRETYPYIEIPRLTFDGNE